MAKICLFSKQNLFQMGVKCRNLDGVRMRGLNGLSERVDITLPLFRWISVLTLHVDRARVPSAALMSCVMIENDRPI